MRSMLHMAAQPLADNTAGSSGRVSTIGHYDNGSNAVNMALTTSILSQLIAGSDMATYLAL